MLGHSIGELVAACLAGVMELDDALAVVAERGRLMGEMPPGAMLSVPLPEDDLRTLLSKRFSNREADACGTTRDQRDLALMHLARRAFA